MDSHAFRENESLIFSAIPFGIQHEHLIGVDHVSLLAQEAIDVLRTWDAWTCGQRTIEGEDSLVHWIVLRLDASGSSLNEAVMFVAGAEQPKNEPVH